ASSHTLFSLPKQDFPFPNLGPMQEEKAVRKRKMAREPQGGEEEVSAPFPLSPAPSPSPAGPRLQDNPAAKAILLGMHWGDLLPPSCGTEINPILSLSFFPQTRREAADTDHGDLRGKDPPWAGEVVGAQSWEQLHDEEKLHECLECGKSFSQSFNLLTHLQLHTGERRWECRECGKRYRHSSHLYHQRVHTTEQPYTCLECGKSFMSRAWEDLQAQL
uniref:C2H2-type domain-containing protein n=1 Tax=Zonotrichia albicollis TaxID=44394 RepID=A0A8D2MGM7_ZONAL